MITIVAALDVSLPIHFMGNVVLINLSQSKSETTKKAKIKPHPADKQKLISQASYVFRQ